MLVLSESPSPVAEGELEERVLRSFDIDGVIEVGPGVVAVPVVVEVVDVVDVVDTDCIGEEDGMNCDVVVVVAEAAVVVAAVEVVAAVVEPLLEASDGVGETVIVDKSDNSTPSSS